MAIVVSCAVVGEVNLMFGYVVNRRCYVFVIGSGNIIPEVIRVWGCGAIRCRLVGLGFCLGIGFRDYRVVSRGFWNVS